MGSEKLDWVTEWPSSWPSHDEQVRTAQANNLAWRRRIMEKVTMKADACLAQLEVGDVVFGKEDRTAYVERFVREVYGRWKRHGFRVVDVAREVRHGFPVEDARVQAEGDAIHAQECAGDWECRALWTSSLAGFRLGVRTSSLEVCRHGQR